MHITTEVNVENKDLDKILKVVNRLFISSFSSTRTKLQWIYKQKNIYKIKEHSEVAQPDADLVTIEKLFVRIED